MSLPVDEEPKPTRPTRDEALEGQGSRPVAARRGLWAILACAVALRLWGAAVDHGILWPDEIYQSLEQAHRLAFGYGIVPWEFRDGARSWLFPGALAGLLEAAQALGARSPLALVSVARGGLVALGAWSIWSCARLTTRLSGWVGGLCAAGVLALLAPALIFSYRTGSESASAALVVGAFWLLSLATRRGALLAGACAGVACLVRYQNVIFFVVVAAILLARGQRDVLRRCSLTAALALLGGGLLDWITWGSPFHSALTYFQFNLLEDGASSFGVSPPLYYLTHAWQSTGPGLLVLAPLGCLGLFARPLLGLPVVAYLLVHSLIPHKELRFIVPALPLGAALVGVGAERAGRFVRERWPQTASGPRGPLAAMPAIAAPAIAAIATLASASSSLRLGAITFGDLGQYVGTPRALESPWTTDEERANRLLARAGQRADVCGLVVLGLRAAFTGGYSYFHRDVPLAYRQSLCSAGPSANYVLAHTGWAETSASQGYVAVEGRGPLSLFRREGGCAPALERDELLEGARDMGLPRLPPSQGDDGVLRIDPVRDSGAFVSGWGHGERIDCKSTRWATGKRSTLEFELTDVVQTHALDLELRAYEGASPQSLRAFVGDQEVHSGELPTVPTRITTFVPGSTLERGVNRLTLRFSSAKIPGGNDTRNLAAQFFSLTLSPVSDDFTINVGEPTARQHLIEGFSNDEREGDVAFAWSDGTISTVRGLLANPERPHLLSVTAQALPQLGEQGVDVHVNGRQIGKLPVRPTWSESHLVVPGAALRRGRNGVSFAYGATASPHELGLTEGDTRNLGVRFRHISLTPIPPLVRLDFGTAGARRWLSDGWSNDETDGARPVVWSVKPRASILANLTGAAGKRLRLRAHAFAHAMPLEVVVRINERETARLAPTPSWAEYDIPIPPEVGADSGDVVSFELSRTARPSDTSDSTDSRTLALRVDWLELVDPESVASQPNPAR